MERRSDMEETVTCRLRERVTRTETEARDEKEVNEEGGLYS